MNEKLRTICDTVSKNIQTASTFYKIEYKSSFVAYGITNSDCEPSLDKIEECKQLIKEQVGSSYTLGMYAPRMMMVSKASRSDDPLGTVNKIKETYGIFSKIFGESATVATLSALLADYPGDINVLAAKSKEIMDILKKRHPVLGVSSSDHHIIALMAASDKSADEVINEADRLFDAMKKEFRFAKEDAYTLSYMLSSLSEPFEWKMKAAIALRDDLKASKAGFGGYRTITMLAPLTLMSMRTDRSVLVNQIKEADKFFSEQKIIGGTFGLGDSLRHMLAAACVLKAEGEDENTLSMAEYLTVMSCQIQIKAEQDSSSATVVTTI